MVRRHELRGGRLHRRAWRGRLPRLVGDSSLRMPGGSAGSVAPHMHVGREGVFSYMADECDVSSGLDLGLYCWCAAEVDRCFLKAEGMQSSDSVKVGDEDECPYVAWRHSVIYISGRMGPRRARSCKARVFEVVSC